MISGRSDPPAARPSAVPALAALCAVLALVAAAALLVVANPWGAANQGGPAPSGSGGLVGCFGQAPGFPPSLLTAGPADAEKANTPAAAALRALLADQNTQMPTSGWVVVRESASEVMYVLSDPSGVSAEVTVALKSGTWQATGYGSCGLMAVPPAGYGPAIWTLDPSAPPAPNTTDLQILVDEMACHGDSTAEGRIAVDIQADSTAITMTAAVRSLGGMQTCPGTPPTPYVVHLDQPIGIRMVFDGGTWPAVARVSGGQAIVTAAPTPTPYVHYTAQAEDSLASIAARLHFDPAEITAANPGIDANHLSAGQVVNVPIGHWPSDCGGTDYGDFFKVAGMSVKFALYCAAVPDGWTVKSSTLSQDSSLVRVVYAGPNGESFTLAEGAIDQADYPPTADTTALPLPEFGDKVGWLETVGGQHWCLVPEAPIYWVTIGQGMSLEEFTTLTRSLIRVAT